jgi:hypothetical protein
MAETPRTSERPEPKRAPIGKPMCNGGDLLYISLIYPLEMPRHSMGANFLRKLCLLCTDHSTGQRGSSSKKHRFNPASCNSRSGDN